ncbi:MAG: flagellar export protein FliJ [Intestinimonas sp.]|jgi:flagellar FliJ protein|nr:flagellar export protein FliJ [Intestinimonas sp.]
MKKFQFSLDNVLEYKRQVLDSLEVEHGALTAKVRRQETVLADAERRYARTNEEYREKKAIGMRVVEAVSYETGLRVLEQEIRREAEVLQSFRQQTEVKRREMVAAKQDTSSIEKIREKKLECYNKELQKVQEKLIDDLICARSSSCRQENVL